MKKKAYKEYTSQFYHDNVFSFVVAIVVGLLVMVLNFGVTWVTQQLLDNISNSSSSLSLPTICFITIGIVLLLVLFKYITYFTRPRFLQKAMIQYKDFAFQKLTKKSITAFRQEALSDYLSAFSNDISIIENDYLSAAFLIASSFIVLIGSLIMMLFYSPIMTIVATAFCALPVVVAIWTGNRLEAVTKEVAERNANYLSSLRDALSGFPIIKSMKAEKEISQIVSISNINAEEAKCRKEKLSTLLYSIGAVAGVVAQLGTFVVGCALFRAGYPLTPGKMVAFLYLTGYFIEAVRDLPAILGKHKAASAIIAKQAEALQKNRQDMGIEIPPLLEKGITVKHLYFEYEKDNPVLKDVSYSFCSGKSYAIVGSSGSGKTTFLNLLLGSNSYEGSIMYDEYELQQISSKSLFDLVSIIQQNTLIFNASIRNNITLYKDFPKESVDHAISLSGLSSLIEQKGEDYLCGENGIYLSGGERQRISIARSLLRNTHVLLADEATAALDIETASQVHNAILDLSDMTKIVVTHSLDASILKRYDCILAMKAGQILESGTFDELIAQKGYFYSLYTIAQ